MNTIRIHESNVEAFEDKLAKINRKLDRHAVAGRFVALRVGEEVKELEDGSVSLRYVYEFDAPTFAYSGWEFLAHVQIEEAGTVLRIVPGKSMPVGYERPDAHICEHCGIRRYRTKSYILRNTDTGEIKQVGRNCLELFLGVEVKGLWALDAFTAEELQEMADEPRGYGGGQREATRWTIDTIIRTAYAVTDGGKSFVSRAVAQEYDKAASSNEVSWVLTWRPRGRFSEEQRREVEAMRAAAAAVDADTIAEILAFPKEMSDSDYAENLRVLVNGTTSDYRNLGILTSLVGVWYRAKEKKAAADHERATRLNEWVGQPKERLRNLSLTVTKVREFEGDYGYTTLIMFRDAEGRFFKWWATGIWDVEPGTEVTLTGTVKALETYENLKETVLTRCKMEWTED